jgi:sterol desaturase/sphingolipid hydroxylase (fatty acid hydroxylase superfamily)
VTASWLLPLITFALLATLERTAPRAAARYAAADHALNLAGLAVQGALVPLAGFWIATEVLAAHWPAAAGTLRLGWLGAFLLNFVVVDFLYYWQHRLFHRLRWLWALHQCHHATPALDVWASSRNSLAVNFLFVYMLVNPVLGFLCDRPDAFFAGAALTASLDLWRHSRLPAIPAPRFLAGVLVTPELHHSHHSPRGEAANFGANLIIWDRLFGTARPARGFPARYGTAGAPGPWRQFLFPW